MTPAGIVVLVDGVVGEAAAPGSHSKKAVLAFSTLPSAWTAARAEVEPAIEGRDDDARAAIWALGAKNNPHNVFLVLQPTVGAWEGPHLQHWAPGHPAMDIV